MKYLYKALDFFRKSHRSGERVSIHKIDNYYWMSDGFFAVFIPGGAMELNPSIFKEFNISEALKGEEKAVKLKKTYLQKQADYNLVLIPLNGTDFTVWLKKKYVDLFSPNSDFYGASPKTPVYVRENGNLMGLILPVRHYEEIPTLFKEVNNA